MLAARHLYFLKVLAARKTYLITARARKNKRTARMLASVRKDHSIPLILLFITLRMLKNEKKYICYCFKPLETFYTGLFFTFRKKTGGGGARAPPSPSPCYGTESRY